MTVSSDLTTIDRIDISLGRAVDWLLTMLPAPDGSRGVWERIRIDIDEIVARVRPDSTAETRELFAAAAPVLNRPELTEIAEGLGSWLLASQADDGSFPFYIVEATEATPNALGETGETRYPNDNGKVLELLTLWAGDGDPSVKAAADRLASWLAATQNDEGWFLMQNAHRPGPCFVAWSVVGLARHAAGGGPAAAGSRIAVERALDHLLSLQLPDGRMQTTYEVQRREDWRPVSSETAETLRAFALSQRLLGIDLTAPIAGATGYLAGLTADNGAIRNCDDASTDASLQNDDSLTDLVYTCGYALHAWLDAWRLTADPAHLDAATRLGEFLMSIQVDDPTVAWHGAWRGSYDIDRQLWRGRANQNNPIDEGGEFSVYTGWTASTIANGLLRLRAALAAA